MRGTASAPCVRLDRFLCGLALTTGALFCACSPGEEAHAADTGASVTKEAGQGFLAPPPEVEAPAVEPAAPAPPAVEHQETQPAPREEQPESVPEPTPPKARALVTGFDERALAAALLHASPAAFEAEIALAGSELSTARKNLMLAFAAAAAGQSERAKELARGLGDEPDVSAVEWALLARALGGGDAQALEAGAPSGASDPAFARAAHLALRASQAQSDLAQGRYAAAAQGYSEVLLGDLDSDWPKDRAALRRWSEGLMRAQDGHRWSKRGEWPSVTIEVLPGDSLTTVRKRAIDQYAGLVTCTGLIERANQLSNAGAIHPGDELRIPTDEVYTRVYLGARWLLYMHGEEVVTAWSVGVGKTGEETPVGEFTVGKKQKEPVWYPRGREPVPFGDPENPLGTRWLPWLTGGEKNGYGFHGTNEPDAVGGRVSQGCVRLLNQDVELLYEILPEGSRVVVRP